MIKVAVLCLVFILLAAPLAGRLSDRYSTRYMAFGGSIIAIVAIAFTGQVNKLTTGIILYGAVYG